jgi:outer membrane protein insertion porin family
MLWILLPALFLAGCSNTRYLAEGEELYTGAKIKLNSPEKISRKGALEKELDALPRPKPNRAVFGKLRVRLSLYNLVKDTTAKGFRQKVKYKWGEPPVLFDSLKVAKTAVIIKNRLDNRGFFDNSVSYEIIHKRKRVRVIYTAETQKAYTIDTVYFPPPTSQITRQIGKLERRTLLKTGDRYDLGILKEERSRIDTSLKNRGYYYFNEDLLEFRADTSIGGHRVNLRLVIKPRVPEEALVPYKINEVYIDMNKRFNDTLQVFTADTLEIANYRYINSNPDFRPDVILNCLLLDSGTYYNRRSYDRSIRNLNRLGTFQFASIQLRKADLSYPALNAYVTLIPLKKKTIRAELNATYKSSNFVGPVFQASWQNKNMFRGAERFVFSVIAGFETQIVNDQATGFASYELGPQADLYLPGLVAPFASKWVNRRFMPQTKFGMGYRLLNRTQNYRLNSYLFDYGFLWQENASKSHKFNPVNINYVSVGNISDKFQATLDANPFLERSFENQFIISTSYVYTYKTISRSPLKSQFYFQGGVESAGNLISSIQKLAGAQSPEEGGRTQLAGADYARFLKLDLDVRFYQPLGEKQKLAFRVLSGAAIATGTVKTIPFIKQYFIGGANSVRAFAIRSIGPGTYTSPPDLSSIANFLDQSGDLKLEANAEYRFDIAGFFKGALFSDAGNIWTLQDNPSLPGGQFNRNEFMSQLAVGVGFGFRFDFDIIIVRFDPAFPIRKPWLEPGNRWVIDQINFGSSAWRKDNMVYNIAIGYPF